MEPEGVHKNLPRVPILRKMNPIHTLQPCFPKINFNIILKFTPGCSLPGLFGYKT
jgi:hypothetical protein